MVTRDFWSLTSCNTVDWFICFITQKMMDDEDLINGPSASEDEVFMYILHIDLNYTHHHIYHFLFAISMPWRSLTWDLLQTTVHVKYKMPDLLTLYILCTICVHIDNKNLLEPLFSLNVAFFTGWWQKTCQVVGRHLWAWWKESVSNYNIAYNTSRIDLEPLVLCAKHIKHLQVFSVKKISPIFVCSPLHYRGCCKLHPPWLYYILNIELLLIHL